MIYVEQPLFAAIPLILLAWQVLLYLLRRRVRLSATVDILLTGVGLLGHAVAITVILLGGGTLSDALLTVLFSGALALALSPKPTKEDKR